MAVGREILRLPSSGGGAPGGPARVQQIQPVVPRLVRFLTARRWLLGPKGVPGLESFLLGFWELKCCFGLGFSFGITSYVYIGFRVAFG